MNKNSKKHDSNTSLLDTYRQLEPYLGIGLTFAVYILAFLFVGRWLDQKAGTEPWLMITGAAVGLVLSFVHMLSILKKITEENSDSDSREKD